MIPTPQINLYQQASKGADLERKADTSDILLNVANFTNDSGYQTSSDVASAISNKEDKTDI